MMMWPDDSEQQQVAGKQKTREMSAMLKAIYQKFTSIQEPIIKEPPKPTQELCILADHWTGGHRYSSESYMNGAGVPTNGSTSLPQAFHKATAFHGAKACHGATAYREKSIPVDIQRS